jgi:hypothetical protein
VKNTTNLVHYSEGCTNTLEQGLCVSFQEPTRNPLVHAVLYRIPAGIFLYLQLQTARLAWLARSCLDPSIALLLCCAARRVRLHGSRALVVPLESLLRNTVGRGVPGTTDPFSLNMCVQTIKKKAETLTKNIIKNNIYNNILLLSVYFFHYYFKLFFNNIIKII